jgi:molecular chaperone DnaK
MQSDAESHAEEDRRKFELASARNEGENMCYQLEKMMKEHSEKLKDSDKAPLEAAMKKVRDASESEDVAAIKSAVKELEAASHALSKLMYEKAGATAEAGSTSGTGKSDGDDAIDAEFEVKKD